MVLLVLLQTLHTIELQRNEQLTQASMISPILRVIKLYVSVASAGEMVLLSYYRDGQQRPGFPVSLKMLKSPCDTGSGRKSL
jgi:hypothetical protein